MTNSNPAKSAKKKAISPIMLGVLFFFLMCGAILFNQFREVLADRLFPPEWAKSFQKGEVLAKSDQAAGIALMEKAIAEGEKIKGDDGRKMKVYRSLGEWHRYANRYEDARKDFTKSGEYAKPGMPLDYSNSLADTALLDHEFGNTKDGEACAQKALDIKLKEIGPDHEWVGWVQVALALTATDAGHYKKAEDAWAQAMRIEKPLNRHNGLVYLDCVNGLACTYALEGKRSLADKTFIDNIKEADSRWDAGNSCTDDMIIEYARALKKSGDEKSAQLLLTRIEDQSQYFSTKERNRNM